MPVKLPASPIDAPAEKATEAKFDPFRPEMPQIPGVNRGAAQEVPPQPESFSPNTQRIVQIGGIVVAVILIGAVVFWWIGHKRSAAREIPPPDADVPEQVVAAPVPSVSAAPTGPTVAGTVDELSKPWAAKKFTFVKPVTRENIPAMVVRLPGGELWAFSLHGPFGHCDLEYVKDLGRLASQFRFTASHPMVVSPCDRTVFDPLKIGPIGGNAWARGEIVQGSSLRPPISIEVVVNGRSIIADNIE